MARTVWISLLALVIAGCGSPKSETSERVPTIDPKSQPPVSQTAVKKPVGMDEVKKVLDLQEYPGVEMVGNWRLVSESFSPDEARFEMVRRTKDAPVLVTKYFEAKLGTTSTGKSGHQEIFGRTQRGNFVRVHVDGENTGSKFTLSVISYAK